MSFPLDLILAMCYAHLRSDTSWEFCVKPIVCLCLFVLAAAGCATIFNGTGQELHLTGEPRQAQVSVHDWSGNRVAEPGVSPGYLKIHRPRSGRPYTIIGWKPGYCPQYVIATPDITWAYVVSRLVFSPVASIIDESTGAAWEIRPNEITLDLQNESACQD